MDMDLLRTVFPAKQKDGHTLIGEYTFGEPNVFSWGEGTKLTVGKFCCIAGGVSVMLGGNHRTDWVSTYPFTSFLTKHLHITGQPQTNGDVVIGNDVWICTHATIMSGITIGDGAVIGMNATVTRDVPPYAIVGGNPANLIRYRFSDLVIAKLLRIKWWDWPPKRIEKVVPLIASHNMKAFLDYCESHGY